MGAGLGAGGSALGPSLSCSGPRGPREAIGCPWLSRPGRRIGLGPLPVGAEPPLPTSALSGLRIVVTASPASTEDLFGTEFGARLHPVRRLRVPGAWDVPGELAAPLGVLGGAFSSVRVCAKPRPPRLCQGQEAAGQGSGTGYRSPWKMEEDTWPCLREVPASFCPPGAAASWSQAGHADFVWVDVRLFSFK